MYLRLVEQRRELLLIALLRKSLHEGLTTAQLSEGLEMTEDQLMALLLGIDRVEDIPAEIAQAVAAYLRWPVMGVWLASGAMRLEDFFTPQALQQSVERAYERWPALRSGSALCAVLALALTDEELLPRQVLCAIVDDAL